MLLPVELLFISNFADPFRNFPTHRFQCLPFAADIVNFIYSFVLFSLTVSDLPYLLSSEWFSLWEGIVITSKIRQQSLILIGSLIYNL